MQNLKQLKFLFEEYIKTRDHLHRSIVINMIDKILCEINQTNRAMFKRIVRSTNTIEYEIDNETKRFYFYGDTFYINGLKLEL